MRTINIVRGEDWEGLYIDGVLKVEDYSPDLHLVLEILGVEYDYDEVDAEWMDREGTLPTNLEDVVLAKDDSE